MFSWGCSFLTEIVQQADSSSADEDDEKHDDYCPSKSDKSQHRVVKSMHYCCSGSPSQNTQKSSFLLGQNLAYGLQDCIHTPMLLPSTNNLCHTYQIFSHLKIQCRW